MFGGNPAFGDQKPTVDLGIENNSSLITFCAPAMAQVLPMTARTPTAILPKGFTMKFIIGEVPGNKLSKIGWW